MNKQMQKKKINIEARTKSAKKKDCFQNNGNSQLLSFLPPSPTSKLGHFLGAQTVSAFLGDNRQK